MSRSSFEHCSPTLLEPDGQCERRSAQRLLSLVAAFPARGAPVSASDGAVVIDGGETGQYERAEARR